VSTYRIFFRDGKNRICGREDFEADTEPAAIRIARDLADACSDVCCKYELWDGEKLISEPRQIEDVCQINERHQEIVIRTEELIRLSNWRVAESRRLIEHLDGKVDRR
jgi:hypothetical protein